MITGYAHFVQLADSLQWDETAIDYSADREAWPALEDAEHNKVLGLVAGFCIAETSVAGQLGSYQAAASVDDSMEACFRAQARDEARHARFFDLVTAEVAGVPGANPAARQDVLRAHVSSELIDLFEHRLPATSQRLAEDHGGLLAVRAETVGSEALGRCRGTLGACVDGARASACAPTGRPQIWCGGGWWLPPAPGRLPACWAAKAPPADRDERDRADWARRRTGRSWRHHVVTPRAFGPVAAAC